MIEGVPSIDTLHTSISKRLHFFKVFFIIVRVLIASRIQITIFPPCLWCVDTKVRPQVVLEVHDVRAIVAANGSS
ncbi:hypothetical protein K439DRAFT_1641785 [Ramaria rubella]|nr:hypothetical protein K439DRAFT_1641785 [Ramaria rubella]